MPQKQQNKTMPTNIDDEPHRRPLLQQPSADSAHAPVRRHESLTTETTSTEKQREETENSSYVQSDQSTVDESIAPEQTEENQRNAPGINVQSETPPKLTPQKVAQRKRFACADCTQLFDDRQTVRKCFWKRNYPLNKRLHCSYACTLSKCTDPTCASVYLVRTMRYRVWQHLKERKRATKTANRQNKAKASQRG